MTLRIKQDLYEQLRWALSIRPDLSLSSIVRTAIRVCNRRLVHVDDPGSGDVVLNIETDEPVQPSYVRSAIAWYLSEQRRKIDARKVAPLDLEPCTTYTVQAMP
jgi:hypothetical protein